MHRMMSIAALEYVGTGLGYRFDGLNENKPNEYNDAAKALNPLTFKLSTFRVFVPWMVKLGPAGFRKALVDWLPWPDARRVKSVIYKIDDIAQDILKTRRKAMEEREGYGGKDILSAMSENQSLLVARGVPLIFAPRHSAFQRGSRRGRENRGH
jgi:hypothetical protein